jgi:phage shock protein PspC (stress-responsive transcriptional regulator)
MSAETTPNDTPNDTPNNIPNDTPNDTPNQPRDNLPHDQRRARRPNTNERLFRSRSDRVWGGVLGGIGHYVGIDPHMLRISYVLITIITAGIGMIGYLLLWWLIPVSKNP